MFVYVFSYMQISMIYIYSMLQFYLDIIYLFVKIK